MADVVIDGIIGWDVFAEDVRDQLRKAGDGPIDIEISSPGGSVFEGLAIYNLIKAHKGETNVIITGLAASMASYIALAADNVQAHENSVYMIHNARVFSAGDHRDLRKSADRLESLTNMLSRAYVAKTGDTPEKIRQMMDDETFLFGSEIKDAGFADSIIESEGADATAKDESIELARMSFEDCAAKMKEDEKPDDLEKAAALLEKPGQKPTAQQPKEEKDMNLTEFLAKNPEAKAEHEAALAAEAKKVEPVTAAAPEVEPVAEAPEVEPKADTSNAVAIATSEVYPADVKAVAVAVLAGKASQETLAAVVAMHDARQEKAKSATAQKETDELEETPAAQENPSALENGVASTPQGIAEAGAKIKAMNADKGDK